MHLVVRSVVIFFFVFALTRVLGRRELSSLEPFDIILLVVIGDLVQQGITQSDDSVTGTLIVLSTIGLMTVGVSYANFRVRRLRPLLEGEPLVLVDDGRVIDHHLARERITTDDLAAQARLQNLASLDDVRWAVLETNGQISFIPKKEKWRSPSQRTTAPGCSRPRTRSRPSRARSSAWRAAPSRTARATGWRSTAGCS